MQRERSVVAPIERVEWERALPPVSAVRPASCTACGRASRPAGGKLRLHGHGTRTRDRWGPPEPGAKAEATDLRVRRYRCVDCHAITTVVPRGLLPRHLYLAGAIGLALALWSCGMPASKVRAQTSPWTLRGGTRGWRSLHRWTNRPPWPIPALRLDRRAHAARIAGWLAAHAISSAAALDLPALAFEGAQRARVRDPPIDARIRSHHPG